MTDEVSRYLRKAEHALEVAEDLLKDMPRMRPAKSITPCITQHRRY
jgi:hypothetical protein